MSAPSMTLGLACESGITTEVDNLSFVLRSQRKFVTCLITVVDRYIFVLFYMRYAITISDLIWLWRRSSWLSIASTFDLLELF